MADPIELLTQLTKDYKSSLLLTKELILELRGSCDREIHVDQLELVTNILAKLEWVEVS